MNYVSLFTGAGGFDLGFDAAGFRCLAQVEIDRQCQSVLALRWPDVPKFTDVRAFGRDQVPGCDVVVGGFPCQDLSVAGNRAGFAGERSSLFFEMVRVIRELRPAYVVWENVPGLLSSAEGRDFLAVLVELGDLGFDGGWRTVDAQYFGVPQSRRRVFGVFARGRTGAERCAEILALTPGVSRHPAPGRKAGAKTPGSAGSGTEGGGRVGYEIAAALRASGVGSARVGDTRGQDTVVVAAGGNDTRGERRVSAALSTKATRNDFETETFVVAAFNPQAGGNQTLLGFNENLTGSLGASQVPAVCCVGSLAPDATPKGREDGIGYTLTNRKRGHGSGQAVCVTVPVTHTLTSNGADAGEDGTGRGTPIVASVAQNQRGELRMSNIATAVTCGGGKPGEGYSAAMVGSAVRRLTPRECERLMGWPDDHTRYCVRVRKGKKPHRLSVGVVERDGETFDVCEVADGPRYRMCGNGVVGTVAEWIARRLAVQMQQHKEAA